ncbi:MAG: Gfo/Idh/MocA family oxidoreductase [Alphaproteobacteria bacterium]|nr:Gfo/Idh/MocA family oxidoreductase [Alphaproteobacteria bacterium]
MAERRIGIVMHGVTGRMGANQHLARSIAAIRADGGVRLGSGERLMPDPILVGRNAEKLAALAAAHGVERWTTDLDAALADPRDTLFFDAGSTLMRADLLHRAIAAGKHVYCEKPVAGTLADAVALVRAAEARGIRHGVVQDKLFLPGLRKLKLVIASGLLGRLFAVRGEFGYWVFEGDWQPPQRPAWNYKKNEGGGIILDMLCHWRYVLDNLFAPVRAVSCLGATHIPRRVDETGNAYDADADDAAYATFQLEGGIVAHINSSWCTRVRRDDLLVLQVDGTHGSAVAGLQKCWTQPRANTPKPVWNPDIPQPIDFFAGWQEVPDNIAYTNAFRAQWELMLRHCAHDSARYPHDSAGYVYDLRAGARGVQLAEAGLRSWRERRWVDLEELAF